MSRVETDWKKADKFIDKQFDSLFNKLGAVAVADAKNNALFDTGRMKQSIRYIATPEKLRVEAQTNYAVYVEYLYKPFLRPLISKFSGWIGRL